MPRPNCPRRVKLQANLPVFVPLAEPVALDAVPDVGGGGGVYGTKGHEGAADSFVELTLDEWEAIRLADYEGLYQEAAARSMGVSRQTFGRILQQAHRKIAEALLFGRPIKIRGGAIRPQEEEHMIKIAVPTTEHGAVDQHFGHCEKFTLFEVDKDRKEVVSTETVPAPENCGCQSNIASVLSAKGVKVLLTGGIGPGAVRVLEGYGIQVVRGAGGHAEQAVKDYLEGLLKDSGEICEEHSHAGHGKGHRCGR